MSILAEHRGGPGGDRVRAGRSGWLIAVGAALAVAAGTILAMSPLVAFGAVAAVAVTIIMATLGRRSAQVFVISLGVLLIAYAFLGRGVAYVGTGSFFIGELVLFLGILAFALNLGHARFGPFQWLLVAFIAVGLIRTLPFLGQYGIVALRDAVVWGYALFALAVATTFDPRWLEHLTRAYRWFIPAFLLWVPVATGLELAFAENLPSWPGAPVAILEVKQGDFAVMLAGIAAFILVGLYEDRRGRIPSAALWALLFLDLAIVGVVSRGGLLAAVIGVAGALLFVRSSGRLLTAGGIALAGFILLYALNPSLDVGSNQGRTLSFTQLVDNITSVVLDSDRGNLQGTKEWRLAWWEEIIDYTVDGPYFWTGKGFGINLADDDGFQVLADRSLRAPHNGHMALLARGGVPLVGLWILIQVAFGIGLFRAARRARAAGEERLVMVAAWIFAFWSAALVNMTFDVYLEGPQGGIWFWSVIGLGIVVMDAARRAAIRQSEGDPVRPAGGDVAGGSGGPGRSAAPPPARPILPAVSPTTGATIEPATGRAGRLRSVEDDRPVVPEYLPASPPSVTSAADDFFDGLVRRTEGPA
jgi:hypothetical protein